jgi:TIR domain
MKAEDLSLLIQRALTRSGAVEIDGLGVFKRDQKDEKGTVTFFPPGSARIFIAYACEDRALADRLYDELKAQGYDPWLDRRKLLPGQDWPRRIEDAIASSDFVLACYSPNSVNKRGGFQIEVRLALECAKRIPLDDVFLIPVRFERCKIPSQITREIQYVDLFPDWAAGLARIVNIIERQRNRAA